MKTLEKVLAILALLILTTQMVRHAYLLWLEPRGSVLDKYDQPTKSDIAAATSLDQLLSRYDAVRKEVDAADKQRPKDEPMPSYGAEEKEPYKSAHMLRDAITSWEARAAEIRAVRFYSGVGFFLCLAGFLIYRKWNRWFGLTSMIVAFSEIIYWTSPTFLGPNTREFDRLLLNKLVLTVVSLVLLVAVVHLQGIFAQEEPAPAAAAARTGR